MKTCRFCCHFLSFAEWNHKSGTNSSLRDAGGLGMNLYGKTSLPENNFNFVVKMQK
jgi:hypothetical protein